MIVSEDVWQNTGKKLQETFTAIVLARVAPGSGSSFLCEHSVLIALSTPTS
jgi:hypothetical protein